MSLHTSASLRASARAAADPVLPQEARSAFAARALRQVGTQANRLEGLMQRMYLAFSLTAAMALCALLPACVRVHAGSDDLESWADGPAKRAIIDFVRVTTDKSSPKFVPEDRIATFDQEGTTWVSHPIYSQILFAFDRVVAPQHPEWKSTAPFSCILGGDKAHCDRRRPEFRSRVCAAGVRHPARADYRLGA